MLNKRLQDKVAIVTGSGQGIGRGVANRLAEEGAAVVIADYNLETATNTAQEIEAAGGQALAYQIDIALAAATKKMVADVVAEFGRVDILVNNAGVSQTKPMLDLTEADWDRVIDINQRGTFFCLQAVAEQLIKQLPPALRDLGAPADIYKINTGQDEAGDTPNPTDASPDTVTSEDDTSYGKIVNIASISGRKGRSLATHYAASKAAIISLTQSAALALAPYKINVNAISPGVVPTSMWVQIDAERGELFGTQPGQAMKAFIDLIPLKRASKPADIGAAVAFFCSSDADYITGQTLNVDGGFEMN